MDKGGKKEGGGNLELIYFTSIFMSILEEVFFKKSLLFPGSFHLFAPLITRTHNLRVESEGYLPSEQFPLIY